MTTTKTTKSAQNLGTVQRWIDAAEHEMARTRRDSAQRFDYLIARELRSELGYFAKQARTGTLDGLEVLRIATEIRRSALIVTPECADDEMEIALRIEVAAQIASLATAIA